MARQALLPGEAMGPRLSCLPWQVQLQRNEPNLCVNRRSCVWRAGRAAHLHRQYICHACSPSMRLGCMHEATSLGCHASLTQRVVMAIAMATAAPLPCTAALATAVAATSPD